MKDVYCVYGASGHSKVIIEILENSGYTIKELYDDDLNKTTLLDYKVNSRQNIFEFKELKWVIGIGDNNIRKKIAESHFLSYGQAIDIKSNISKRSLIGVGTTIMTGVTINSSVTVGNHVIVNTNASIDHDCVIGDYSHISPNAVLCGGVKLGEGVHVGAGATVIPGISIGNWAKIGAGSVIIKDIPDYATVVGNPGKVIKIKKENEP